jgi:hypothetical protein
LTAYQGKRESCCRQRGGTNEFTSVESGVFRTTGGCRQEILVGIVHIKYLWFSVVILLVYVFPLDFEQFNPRG